MQGDGEVQGGRTPPGDPGSLRDFEAKIVLHLVYSNEASASVAGHRMHGYANATVRDSRWFQSKEAFMGAMCKAFESFWDEMHVG